MTMATPLSGIADAFEELAEFIQSRKAGEEELRLDRFCEACSLVSVLFGCLGLAFKFAELEYVAKVHADTFPLTVFITSDWNLIS